VVALVGSATLVWPQANGAMIGVLALFGAFLAESVLLGRRLFGRRRDASAYPDERPAAEASPTEEEPEGGRR